MTNEELKDILRSRLQKRKRRSLPRSGNPFAPSRASILERHIRFLGPQKDALHCLLHLGDKEFFAPSRDGLDASWTEIVEEFIRQNPLITWSSINIELERSTECQKAI